jgi:hypothetical protein
MKQYRGLIVLLLVVFLSACIFNARAEVDKVLPNPNSSLSDVVEPTTHAAISTIISTLSTKATETTTFICAFKVSGCSDGCFSYYEIIEGTYMTDTSCDRLIQVIQVGLDKMASDTGNRAIAERVDSYPTSPIICTKAYTGHSMLMIVDTDESVVSQKLCDSLP